MRLRLRRVRTDGEWSRVLLKRPCSQMDMACIAHGLIGFLLFHAMHCRFPPCLQQPTPSAHFGQPLLTPRTSVPAISTLSRCAIPASAAYAPRSCLFCDRLA